MVVAVPGPVRVPRLGVRDVPFPVAHLRRPHRMTDITVSRPGGRPVTHGNVLVSPFLPVSPYPGMLALGPEPAPSGGKPRSRPDRWTAPVFPSRLSHVSRVSPAPNRPGSGPWPPGLPPGMKRKSFSAQAA